MGDALQDAAETLIEQLIQKGQTSTAKEQALLDLLTRPKMADPPSTKDT